MCSGPWILESAIFVSEWYLNWPFWDLVSEQFQKDSPIDNFSCYDNEPVTDNGELVCHECIDPINPYLDIDEDLDDDAFVHICSPGDASTLSTKFGYKLFRIVGEYASIFPCFGWGSIWMCFKHGRKSFGTFAIG